jgi:hypothetical protein
MKKSKYFSSSTNNQTTDMTRYLMPQPPPKKQQLLQITQILEPTPSLSPTPIIVETDKKQCSLCKKSVITTPESIQTGICFACRQHQSAQRRREEAKQKPPPALAQSPKSVNTSPYFQNKRTIHQLYQQQQQPKPKIPKITQSKMYVCEQTTINKDNKSVCPLCKLTPLTRNKVGLCSSCKKYRLDRRKNNCSACGDFLGFVGEFYLCLCAHSFCISCDPAKIACCSQNVKIKKQTHPL